MSPLADVASKRSASAVPGAYSNAAIATASADGGDALASGLGSPIDSSVVPSSESRSIFIPAIAFTPAMLNVQCDSCRAVSGIVAMESQPASSR